MSDQTVEQEKADELKKDLSNIGKKVSRVTKEQFVDYGSDDRPNEEDMSEPEQKAARESKNMSFHDMIERVGGRGYENWKIIIYRKEPSEFEGKTLKLGKLTTVPKGLSMNTSDLEKYIEKKFGGGVYTVRIFDKVGSLRVEDIEIDADPKVDEKAAKTNKISELKEQLEAEEIKEQIDDKKNRHQPKGTDTEILVAMIQSLTQASSDNMKLMMDQQAAARQDLAEMRRDESEKQRQHEKEMEQLRLEREKNRPEKSTTELVITAAIPLLTAMIQSSAERARLERDRSDSQFNTILQMQQNKGGDTEMLKMIGDAVLGRNDIMGTLMVEMLRMSQEGNDTDPKFKMMQMIMDTINRSVDVFRTGIETKKLLGAKLLDVQAKPGAQPAPQPAGPAPQAAAQPQEKPTPPERTQEELNAAMDFYEKLQVVERIPTLLRYMIDESQVMPHPTNSIMCHLACCDLTPEIFVNWIKEVNNIAEFRQSLYVHINEKAITDMLDNTIFNIQDRVVWLDSCVKYIRDYYLDVEQGDEEGEDDEGYEEEVEEDLTGAGEDYEPDERIVENPGEPIVPKDDTPEPKKDKKSRKGKK